jgi:hypothetical protein
MVRIIINSDDFGLNSEVNYAIQQSFEQKLITSTTTLVGFQEGFMDSVKLVKSNKIPKEGVGIHLNLTEGIPTNQATVQCQTLCKNGNFHGQIRNKPIFQLSKNDEKFIYNELMSQVEKFIDAFGFTPSHIDGHHHIHTEWAITKCVIKIAKKFNIKRIRVSRNMGLGISFPKKIYKIILNRKLNFYGFKTTDYFGDFNDLEHFDLKDNSTVEVMVHSIPGKDPNEVYDIDNQNLSTKRKSLKKYNNLNFINFSEL